MSTRNMVAGALAGTVAGVLLAPKPGKEPRHIIAGRLENVRGKVGDRFTSWRRTKRNGRHSELIQAPSEHDVVAAS